MDIEYSLAMVEEDAQPNIVYPEIYRDPLL
jgi:hypothetical protein